MIGINFEKANFVLQILYYKFYTKYQRKAPDMLSPDNTIPYKRSHSMKRLLLRCAEGRK